MIKEKIKRYLYAKEWRRRNPHNTSTLSYPVDMNKVTVGINSYGFINVNSYNVHNKLVIGNYCSIGPNVIFILDADHRINTVSTFPFRVNICGEQYEAVSKGDIIVDDDVWIGYGATILSGVHISRGAIIAAGAVVSSDVEPYSIVGGVPAKQIKKRFSDDIISELLKIDYNNLSDELVKEHIDELYQTIERKEQLEWMPKKGR